MDAPLLEGHDFTIVEWTDGGETSADSPIAPLHIHDCDDEAWYVLDGALGVRRGDETLIVRAGSGVLVPAGTPHSFWNADDTPTRYLIVMPPRVAALVRALHEPFDDIHALFHRFDSRIVQ